MEFHLPILTIINIYTKLIIKILYHNFQIIDPKPPSAIM